MSKNPYEILNMHYTDNFDIICDFAQSFISEDGMARRLVNNAFTDVLDNYIYFTETHIYPEFIIKTIKKDIKTYFKDTGKILSIDHSAHIIPNLFNINNTTSKKSTQTDDILFTFSKLNNTDRLILYLNFYREFSIGSIAMMTGKMVSVISSLKKAALRNFNSGNLKKHFNSAYIGIKIAEAKLSDDSELKNGWDNILINHILNLQIARKKRHRRAKQSILTACALLIVLSSVIILSSLDKIKTDDFSLVDAIVNLGNKISTTRTNKETSLLPTVDSIEESFKDINEFQAEYPNVDFIEPGYIPEWLSMSAVCYQYFPNGYSVTLTYYNKIHLQFFSIQSIYYISLENLTGIISYPNSITEEIKLEGIDVLICKNEDQYVSNFIIGSVYTHIYTNISRDELIEIITNLF